MTTAPAGSLLEFLRRVPDTRGRQGQRHSLSATLAAVVCAVLCGARSDEAIAQWLHLQEVSTWHGLGFWRTPPKKTGIRSILLSVDPEALEAVVRRWMTETLALEPGEQSLQPVSIDGKTVRGSLQEHERAIHLLSALDQTTGCVLSQTQMPPTTNEAKAALELLKTITLKGRVVVADAMFCQREVCEQILQEGGHSLVVVKENQPTLLREIESAFADTKAFSPLDAAAVC